MFKNFRIADLFVVSTTKSVDKNKIVFGEKGKYDFIGRSSNNYGIQGKIQKLAYEPNKAKTFSLVQVGESVCLYREKEWYASQNIFLLAPINENICNVHLYFEAVINAYLKKLYTEAYIYPTLPEVKSIPLFLPVIKSERTDHQYTIADIDWNYMQERISELEQERISELEAYLIATGLDDYELTIEDEIILKGFFDDSIYFQEMTLQEMGFSIYHGRRLNKSDRIDGDIPFITAGEANQGVAQYISNSYETYHNPITVDMFGNCFYHSGDYAGDDNIYFFVNDEIDEQAKLFIVGEITKKIKGLYSYTRQFRQNDANKLSVKMPLNEDGSINWAYIYIYIRAVEKETIKDIVMWKNKQMSILKSVV